MVPAPELIDNSITFACSRWARFTGHDRLEPTIGRMFFNLDGKLDGFLYSCSAPWNSADDVTLEWLEFYDITSTTWYEELTPQEVFYAKLAGTI